MQLHILRNKLLSTVNPLISRKPRVMNVFCDSKADTVASNCQRTIVILCVRVVLPLCGGNIDTTVLGRCLERGLAAEGRLLKFTVTVSDRPGGIAELCRMLASIGVSIKDIMHERAWIMSDIFSVDVKVVCETRDRAHAEQLKNILYQNYERVDFGNNDKYVNDYILDK